MDNSTTGFQELQVQVPGDSSWDQPPKVFSNNGSFGAEMAHLAFRPALLTRARWFGVAETNPIATIEFLQEEESVLCVANISVMSPTLGSG
jgi:hypothetical protein